MTDKNGNLDSKKAICEEYAYLFDGEKWWVAYYRYNEKTDKYVHTGWLDLESELKREKAEIEEQEKAKTNA
jgi:outer membrane biogenesis lipoprotein LolB